MPRTTIYNSDKTIDSRDIIARIEELQAELGEVTCEACNGEGEVAAGNDGSPFTECVTCNGAGTTQPAVDEDAADELAALVALQDEAERCAEDWRHGETLIRDSYFTDYAREMLKDCGTIPRDLPSWVKIDWEATARNVRVDYTAVNFYGVTYWIR